MQLKSVLTFLASSLLLIPGLALTATKIPVSDDLQTLGLSSQASNLPLMVIFAAEDCSFCDRLEADHLAPMVISKEYDNRIIIRKVMIDSYGDIKDFNGQKVSAERVAKKYGVSVTPTVMIFDKDGNRLSKKLIGYNGNEYYGWDLDRLIDSARERMQHSHSL